MGVDIGSDFESVAKLWLSAKKYRTLNVLTTVVFWTLWKMRNNLCFQGLSWTGGHVLLRRSAKMLRDWCLLNKPEDVVKLELWLTELENRSFQPAWLTWNQTLLNQSCSSSNSVAGVCVMNNVLNLVTETVSLVPDGAREN
jgi:hypothetical protein